MKKEDKPELFIKNGKIVNQKHQVIAPEIGNIEHIALTKKYNQTADLGISNFVIDACLNVEVKFDCLCGNMISCDKDSIDVEVDEDGLIDQDISQQIRGAKTTCHNCFQKYKVAINEDGEMMIRLISEATVKENK